METFQAGKMLQKLQEKSLIDASSKAEKYSIHKLLLSFVQEKGENEMKEMVLNAKVRFFLTAYFPLRDANRKVPHRTFHVGFP